MANDNSRRRYISGSYELEEATFTSYITGEEVSLALASISITVIENMNSPMIAGSIAFNDTADSLNESQFSGYDDLKLVFRTSGLPDEDEYSITAKTVQASFTRSKNNDRKIQMMKFISKEAVEQLRYGINMKFEEQVSSAVEKIFRNLKSDRPLEVHETAGVAPFILNGDNPIQAIQRISKRAYDPNYRTSLYKFYENADGFFFHNIERLIAERRNDVVATYNMGTEEENSDLMDSLFLIQDFNIVRTEDLIEKVDSGMMKSVVREIDYHNKIITQTEFNGYDEFARLRKLDNQGVNVAEEELRDLYESSDPKHNIVVDGSLPTNHYSAMIAPRVFYSRLLSQIGLTLQLNGNSKIRVGDVVDVNIPAIKIENENSTLQEQRISGRYMVWSAIHTLNLSQYSMNLTLVKDARFDV